MVPEMWKEALWERVLVLIEPMGQRASAHSIHALGRSKRCTGRMVSSSPSFWKKEPMSSVSWTNSGPDFQAKQSRHVP